MVLLKWVGSGQSGSSGGRVDRVSSDSSTRAVQTAEKQSMIYRRIGSTNKTVQSSKPQIEDTVFRSSFDAVLYATRFSRRVESEEGEAPTNQGHIPLHIPSWPHSLIATDKITAPINHGRPSKDEVSRKIAWVGWVEDYQGAVREIEKKG